MFRKLFKLEPTKKGHRLLGRNCYHGHVVRAFNPAEARGLADVGREGRDFWMDPTLSRVQEILTKKMPGPVFSLFIPKE